jgi:hypothetical protein
LLSLFVPLPGVSRPYVSSVSLMKSNAARRIEARADRPRYYISKAAVQLSSITGATALQVHEDRSRLL